MSAKELAVSCRKLEYFYIVSNDRIFQQLQIALQMLGKRSYWITTEGRGGVFANKYLTEGVQIGVLPNSTDTKLAKGAEDTVENRLIALVREHGKLPLGKLGQIYRHKYQNALRKALGVKSPLKYLRANNKFKVSQDNVISV